MTGPQAKLMARRAAEVIAVRNLAAKLHGQSIPQDRAGTAHVRMDAVLGGFRYLPPRELPDGTFEVTVELAEPMPCQDHLTDLRAELNATRARLEAQAARLRAAIDALEQQLETLRTELAEVRAALADVRRMEPAASGEPTADSPESGRP
jgi:multidrug resistance efflux pump